MANASMRSATGYVRVTVHSSPLLYVLPSPKLPDVTHGFPVIGDETSLHGSPKAPAS